jgi:hypothetical protein
MVGTIRSCSSYFILLVKFFGGLKSLNSFLNFVKNPNNGVSVLIESVGVGLDSRSFTASFDTLLLM